MPPKNPLFLVKLASDLLKVHEAFLQRSQKLADLITEHTREAEAIKEIAQENRDHMARIQSLPEGKPGKDALVPDIKEIAKVAAGYIERPLDGQNGRDGRDGHSPAIETIIEAVVAQIPTPKNGESVDITSVVTQVLDEFLKEPRLGIDNIKGLRGEIDSYRNQLAGKHYGKDTWARGGGDTVIAGTNITITVDADGNKVINSTGGGGGTPGAPDTSVQFNDSGSFGGTHLLYQNGMGDAIFRTDAGWNYELFAADAVAASGSDGSRVTVEGGAGDMAGSGGSVSLGTGTGGDTGKGGDFSVLAGPGGATSGSGGSISLTAGSAQGGDSSGGQLTFASGEGSGGNNGGNINFQAGGNISDNGFIGSMLQLQSAGPDGGFGNVQINGGTTPSSSGGSISITAGSAQGGDSNGGGWTAQGGAGTGLGDGGSGFFSAGVSGEYDPATFSLNGGSAGDARGGPLYLQAGNTNNAEGDGGYVHIFAGTGGQTSGNGGDIQIAAGIAQGGDGNGGDIQITAGEKNGSGTDGKIKLNIGGAGINAILDTSLLFSSDKTFQFPDQSGVFALVSDIPTGLTFIDNEIVLGSGTSFTLAGTPVLNSEHVYGNGQRLTPGGVDYTISGTSITTVNSFSTGAVLADYRTV